MKVFPGSEQKSDNISPPKHDFETSLKIQIRHGSDNEWEYCTYNKKTLFNFFLQFFKALERTLSSSFDSRNAWKWKQGHNTKERKKKKKSARAGSTPGRTCLLSYNEVNRDDTVLPPSNHLVNHICACDSLSMSLLPRPSPPCQPPLPTTAPQLRCGHSTRP